MFFPVFMYFSQTDSKNKIDSSLRGLEQNVVLLIQTIVSWTAVNVDGEEEETTVVINHVGQKEYF